MIPLNCLKKMQHSGLKPNGSTLAGILPAVGRVGALHLVRSCHGFAIRNALDLDEYVMTALMDAFAESSDLVAARRLFNLIPNKKSIVAWSSMIGGYGTHGYGAEAVMLFEKLQENNI
uniref:Pentatricopeptide repeat-containing protein n=1 Tax=Nelumbo nucifera TaxID=4432 RepID=A0A822ZEU6_NELNU|nr:TPA_asm: hypothetical protein HUJ06_001280 [Nelumbo nucifera]